jgi:hypothetical protein
MPPLRASHVWSIRTKLQLEKRTRDLALFNLAIDSKLRAYQCAVPVRQAEGGGGRDDIRGGDENVPDGGDRAPRRGDAEFQIRAGQMRGVRTRTGARWPVLIGARTGEGAAGQRRKFANALNGAFCACWTN